MKKTFEFDYSDEYGELWMNPIFLLNLVTTSEHIAENLSIKIKDVTSGETHDSPAKRVVTLGGHDF